MSKLIFDATHLANRCFHVSATSRNIMSPIEEHTLRKLGKKKDLTEAEKEEFTSLNIHKMKSAIGLTAHTMINSIVGAIKKYPADEIILAWDKSSWRYKVYSDYKGNRKRKRAEQTVEEAALMQLFYNLMDQVSELLGNTNVMSIKIGQCEADDIVAVICMKSPNEKITVITSDSDFHQLLENPNIRIYDPIKKKLIKKNIAESKYGLFEKLIRGDSSDNIKAAYPRLRSNKMKEMFEDPVLLDEAFRNKEGFKKKFAFNTLLIDFNKIPSSIQNLIWKEYQAQKLAEPNVYKLKEWIDFTKHYKLKEIIGKIDDIRKYMY